MSDQDKSQKTEEPTAKRLAEAHGKGQVAKSQEVSNWFVLSAAALVVAIFAETVASRLRASFVPFLEAGHEMRVDVEGMVDAIIQGLAKGKREITHPRAIATGYVVRALAPEFMRSQLRRYTIDAVAKMKSRASS